MSDEAPEVDDVTLVATFLLGEAAFGVGSQHVQEVVRPGSVTPVHNAPAFVVGIRNLRGRIVTVIDLGIRLDLEGSQMEAESRVVIVDWHGEPVGLLVDRMGDTIPVPSGQVAPPPANVHGVRSRHLQGVHRGPERLVALLDLSTVLQPDASPVEREAARAS